jgi:hypothetical protein
MKLLPKATRVQLESGKKQRFLFARGAEDFVCGETMGSAVGVPKLPEDTSKA